MQWGQIRTKNWESSDPYYDLNDDFDLIVASFQSQYGIRLSRELKGMKWSEFAAFIAGLDHRTPLGSIVAIRAEMDKEALKSFTPEQRRIRNEWRNKSAKAIPQQKVDEFLETMKQTFISMVGGASDEAEMQ